MKVQSSIIDEVIELTDKNGNTLKSIPFRFDVAQMAQRVTELRLKLSDIKADDYEQAGRTTVDLFTAVLGEQAMAELLDFYGDSYVSLVNDLTPLMTDEIFPAIDAYRQRLVQMRKKVK